MKLKKLKEKGFTETDKELFDAIKNEGISIGLLCGFGLVMIILTILL
jgi:hypothetical protein